MCPDIMLPTVASSGMMLNSIYVKRGGNGKGRESPGAIWFAMPPPDRFKKGRKRAWKAYLNASATLRQLFGNASAFWPCSLGRRWVERCELVRELGAEFVGELVRELVREFVGEFVGELARELVREVVGELVRQLTEPSRAD